MKTTATRTVLATLVLCWAFLVPCGSALADSDGEAKRTRPHPRRDSTNRPSDARPDVVPLPDDLNLPAVHEAVAIVDSPDGSRSAAAKGKRPGNRDDLERIATQAGAVSAREVARTTGRIEYYRVGYFRGLRVALADDGLGRWDYRQGVRAGRMDPEARAAGASTGSAVADTTATEAARERVERQFLDLAREPEYRPGFRTPDYAPPASWAVAPTLKEAFESVPIPRRTRASLRFDEAFRDWRYDPWALHRIADYGTFHDRDWKSAGRAFDRWLADRRRSRAYRALATDEERRHFRALFRAAFQAKLARLFERDVLPSYDRGFEDGWDHGADVQYEWAFRRGYAAGFDGAASLAAVAGYRATYPEAFERAYRQAFVTWSGSAHPRILDVTLRDANDDGVFQPGEAILVDYRVANYGGAPGSLPARVSGPHLQPGAETVVRLPRRAVVVSSEPLDAVVVAWTPARTPTRLDLEVGGDSREVAFEVAWPLEFAGEVGLDRTDPLSGRAVVTVRVANRSRRAWPASVTLLPDRVRHDLGRVRAGTSRETSFELTGIRPLDIISGRLSVRFEASSDGTVQDRMAFRFPDRASDLGAGDLLDYLVALARDPAASPADIAEARELVFRRLRVDWRRAVRARGNPYKRDLKRRTTETALGELVATWRVERTRAAQPDVFTGLGDEIAEFARDLPGMHPFLRRSMKKLARRLG
jgi:hypothetical protein